MKFRLILPLENSLMISKIYNFFTFECYFNDFLSKENSCNSKLSHRERKATKRRPAHLIVWRGAEIAGRRGPIFGWDTALDWVEGFGLGATNAGRLIWSRWDCRTSFLPRRDERALEYFVDKSPNVRNGRERKENCWKIAKTKAYKWLELSENRQQVFHFNFMCWDLLKSGPKQVKLWFQSLEIFTVKLPLSEHTYQVMLIWIVGGKRTLPWGLIGPHNVYDNW